MAITEELEIVIIGGGISGLATAVALHRKGIRSVVLEKAETLRATGVGIVIQGNGWRALRQLGIDSKIRHTATAIKWMVFADNRAPREYSITDEARCVLRSDIIEALAEELPPNTLRLGCQVQSISVDKSTSIIQLADGKMIKAKVLIGCDGANSMVGKSIGIRPARLYNEFHVVRGRSVYPNGHGFAPTINRTSIHDIFVLTIPMDDTTVYWSANAPVTKTIAKQCKDDPEFLKRKVLEGAVNFPPETLAMIKASDLDSLVLSQLSYRAPLDLITENYRKGGVTVAGDALHVSGPFLGQGGAAALEDAVVLARCFAGKMSNSTATMTFSDQKAREEALDAYLKERKPRILALCTETYLIGVLLGDRYWFVKLLCVLIMLAFFRDPLRNTRFDCGRL